MSSIPKIRNIEGLLKNQLAPNEHVVDTKITRLTVPGENFGSEMMSLVIEIRDDSAKTERTLYAAAKLIPEKEEVRELFDTQVTYKSEFQFYNSVGPTLDKFLKKNGFPEGADFIAPLYGGRLNLDGSDRVDEDAVILMANLKVLGYSTGDKFKGLDISRAQVALRALAKFHAAGIGYRHQNPESFEENFRPYFYYFIGDHLHEVVFDNLLPVLKSGGFSAKEMETVTSVYQGIAKKKDVSEIWGTLIHYDTWLNNILIKHEGSEPKQAVLVDYQVFEYGTPLNDVMLFLFTSIQLDVLKKEIDNLLDYYFNSLVENLGKLGLDISKFSRDSFNEEVAVAVKKYEYHHTMWMLVPILSRDLESETAVKPGTILHWSDEHKDRIKLITRLCLKKGWF
ncbi:uncharacterized protein LOC109534916 [Dendroctonus ponderosae]|uniref:CHK kinase-like domain-containing protein n=1 Tax=Dendroctonus ponderosae TaxID=77166 RepID=A0AAR5P583_DENPD|nr:uncharacterized protein LOC109534916 [Dendroctonus ponderosae]KAH1020813.1 hypothetical protein HUJ04_010412 [Dendroctonus ponderosae]KAH1027815.1 hypothetical protein HUJ05_001253 [Dendroctonus ponderosae]